MPPILEPFSQIGQIFIIKKFRFRNFIIHVIIKFIDMQGIDLIFAVAILIMSVVVHEVSHGYMADYLGDRTARYAGRLTLNPINHLDPVGSFFVPLMTSLLGGFIFGWAKPVPFNPYNLSNQKYGPGLVGLAGPASNVSVALVFGLIVRFGGNFGLAPEFLKIAGFIAFINLILAFFNMIPIPPLDGSRVLFSLLPLRYQHIQYFLEQYGLIFIFLFIFVFWQMFLPAIFFLFRILTGLQGL